MTRSGVFNSVHSFTQSAIGPTILVFLAAAIIFSVTLLAMRIDRLEAEGNFDSAVSREGMFLVNNLLFVVLTFTVLIGTVFPLVVEAVKGRQMSVGRPYFDRMAVPVGAALLFLLGVGPALPWGRCRRDGRSGGRCCRRSSARIDPPQRSAMRSGRAQPLDADHAGVRRLRRAGDHKQMWLPLLADATRMRRFVDVADAAGSRPTSCMQEQWSSMVTIAVSSTMRSTQEVHDDARRHHERRRVHPDPPGRGGAQSRIGSRSSLAMPSRSNGAKTFGS